MKHLTLLKLGVVVITMVIGTIDVASAAVTVGLGDLAAAMSAILL